MVALAEMTKPKTDEPERRCIATGESAPKAGLIRFVVGPDGGIVPDLGERLPGRGIWVGADRDALQKAVDRKLFARAAKAGRNPGFSAASVLSTPISNSFADLTGVQVPRSL